MQKLLNLAGAKALRKNSKKGFTLVEIIVVIVIIAILLAALTPAVIGWINEARDRALMAEGRTGLVATQAILTEMIATWDGETPATNPAVISSASPITGDVLDTRTKAAPILFDQSGTSEYPGKFSYLIGTTLSAGSYYGISTDPNGELMTINYRIGGAAGTGRIASWRSWTGQWTVDTTAAPMTPPTP